jgi:hypothetical protein
VDHVPPSAGLAELALALGYSYLSREESVAAIRRAGDFCDLAGVERDLAELAPGNDPAATRARQLLQAAFPDRSDHVVAFYEDDAFLVGSVSRYLSAGLQQGEAVIVVATSEHRAALEANLVAAGHDVERSRHEERYLDLDAADTLATLVVDGQLDPGRFERTAGGMLVDAGAGGRRIRLYGEMVALLWEAGHLATTLELEDRWNELIGRIPASVFCGYPLDGFESETTDARFHDVCARHTAVTLDAYAHVRPGVDVSAGPVLLAVEEPGGRAAAPGTAGGR